VKINPNKANLLGRWNLPKPSPKPAALRLPPAALWLIKKGDLKKQSQFV